MAHMLGVYILTDLLNKIFLNPGSCCHERIPRPSPAAIRDHFPSELPRHLCTSLVFSRLDSRNAILAGLPECFCYIIISLPRTWLLALFTNLGDYATSLDLFSNFSGYPCKSKFRKKVHTYSPGPQRHSLCIDAPRGRT